MKVLVACEYSGVVRDAFRAAGHDAWSCDVLPTEVPGPHVEGDVRDVLGDGWDLMIAHPPCTHLAVSGARWFPSKRAEQREALDFVRTLLDAPVPRIALENPVSIISSRFGRPTQTVQPWWFRSRRGQGHMPLADESAAAAPHACCRGSRRAGASHAARAGSVAGAVPHAAGCGRGDGIPVGHSHGRAARGVVNALRAGSAHE